MGQTQQQFWNKWIPKKHNVFIWRFVQNRIPTRRNLIDMRMDIPSTLCPLCEVKEESSQHLFFECRVSSSFWSKLGCWWKVNIPTFHRNEDPLDWSWFAVEKRREGLWFQVSIMAVLTSIWSIRNGAVFDNKKVVVDTEFCRIQELAFFWLRSRNRKFKMELNNWILNPKHNM